MNYQVIIKPSAEKALEKLDRSVQERIVRALEGLSLNPRPSGSIQMKGGNGEYRIRIGDYRVIYVIEDERVLIYVVRIGHRRDIYR